MARRAGKLRGAANAGTATLISRSAICVLGGISERQLTLWEREELVAPALVAKIDGRPERLYNREALRRIQLIRTLADELDVNLPGIAVILHLLEQIAR